MRGCDIEIAAKKTFRSFHPIVSLVAETTVTRERHIGPIASFLGPEFVPIRPDVIERNLAGSIELDDVKVRIFYLEGRAEVARGRKIRVECRAARLRSLAAALVFLDEAISAAIAVHLTSFGLADFKAVDGG